jgi:hypothetical protein
MDSLLADIKAFCEAHDLKPTRFGELALNDKPFVAQLEAGRRLWPETEAKVRRFMSTYRPHQADAA